MALTRMSEDFKVDRFFVKCHLDTRIIDKSSKSFSNDVRIESCCHIHMLSCFAACRPFSPMGDRLNRSRHSAHRMSSMDLNG